MGQAQRLRHLPVGRLSAERHVALSRLHRQKAAHPFSVGDIDASLQILEGVLARLRADNAAEATVKGVHFVL